MNRSSALAPIVILLVSSITFGAKPANHPNLVVICIDDLNDWIGCLGGHPQAKTPNMDRIASQGMVFENAHVQATYCGPSRVSFLSGLLPRTSKCYDFTRYSALRTLEGHPPFPMHLRQQGYETLGGGKIFHHGTGSDWVAKSWDQVIPSGRNPTPPKRVHWQKKVWDWGAWPESDDQMGDFQLAQTAAQQLRQPRDRPVLMVVGFRRPHVPLHVPKRWFDQHPLKDIQLPKVIENDLDDVPRPEFGLTPYQAPRHSEIKERKLWASLVQAYLASISFVDHCVGEVLQGVADSPSKRDTYVILFSDHGFHLGEKQHWAKRTLWEETTRVPLLISGPGIRPSSRNLDPVGLIDIYPTICDLASVTPLERLEGHSLKPLLEESKEAWPHRAVTTFQPGDHSVRSRSWRYIRYADQSEELYNHGEDSNEWTNLAESKKHQHILEEHRDYLNVTLGNLKR